ncbi:hypothetical protein Daus18300_010335 [Diaporthe australafricana]|uniref:SET domain-containing protein n=1 Tax=Diaporthe australafricana TaxID=127596 RepID=A0ABR3WAR4_9PEZI
MSPLTSGDKMMDQRVQQLPDQADTPGSPTTKDLPDEARSASTSGPGPSPSPSSSPSQPRLSHAASSSPLSSSTEDGDPTSSSSPSDYDTDSSGEGGFPPEKTTGNAPEGAAQVGFKDGEETGTHNAATIGSQPTPRPVDTCLGAGCWAPGDITPPNRGFANEHIAVAASPLGGHGVFAAADIEEDTPILVEEPLLRLKGLGRLCAAHARLGGEERAVYDGLVGYHEDEICPVLQKWSANQFDLAADYNAVFAIASNFNHACRSRRNTEYDWDDRLRVMTFTAIKDIKKGDEILISYCRYRHVLKAVYGFVCHCGGCDHQAV